VAVSGSLLLDNYRRPASRRQTRVLGTAWKWRIAISAMQTGSSSLHHSQGRHVLGHSQFAWNDSGRPSKHEYGIKLRFAGGWEGNLYSRKVDVAGVVRPAS
jgi:hypothetical protein